MKNLLLVALALMLFSCGNVSENSCFYYSECSTGCLEQVGEKYYCSHCCLAESQKPEGYEELDKANMNTPAEISEEEVKKLNAAR